MVGGCLFCQRHNPDLNTVIAGNGTCWARLDNYPAAAGHIEVLPKRHVVSFFDLTPQELTDVYELLRQARAYVEANHPAPDGWTIGVNEGGAAGRTIGHLHIHLIPRYYGDVEDPRGGIRQCAPNSNPDAWSRP